MWRYEVAFYDNNGLYQWKGFGDKAKFDRFLGKLVKKGFKIVGIINMDGREDAQRYKEMYVSK